jgi:hypothetical protein
MPYNACGPFANGVIVYCLNLLLGVGNCVHGSIHHQKWSIRLFFVVLC